MNVLSMGAALLAIMISTASAGAQSPPELLWLAATPHLVIGANARDPMDDLFRVAGVAETPSGRIAVVNAGNREVRIFGGDGKWVCTAGRGGEGPGEFPMSPALVPAQRYDSLVVESLPRVMVIKEDCSIRHIGEVDVLRQVVTAGTLPGAIVLARHDGRQEKPESQRGLRISILELFVAESPASPGRRAGGVEYRAYYTMHPGGALALPLTVPASAAVSDERLLITDGVSPFVLSFAPPAFREVRLPIPIRGERVTGRQFRAALADRSAAHRSALRDAPRPEWHPVVRRLLADGGGGFWAELYDPAPDGRVRWLAFSPAGQALGIVRTPVGLHVWQVGPDFILGVAKDEWGEERVERYHLSRGVGPPRR